MSWFARWYVPYLLRKNFSRIQFHGLESASLNKSILLLANHSGWWDPFFTIEVNQKFLHKNYFVMMLEEQLRQRSLLRTAGAYSVKKNSRSAVESLQYTCELLSDSQNLVQLFPQGKIESSYVEHIDFEKGIDFVLKNSQETFTLVFQVSFTDYFSNRKPEAHVFFTSLNYDSRASLGFYEESFNRFYHECRKQMIQLHS